MMVRKALSLTIWIIWLPITGPAASSSGGSTMRRNSARLEKPKATPASIGSPGRAAPAPRRSAAPAAKTKGDPRLDRLARLRRPGAAQKLGHVGRIVNRERDQPGGPVVESHP